LDVIYFHFMVFCLCDLRSCVTFHFFGFVHIIMFFMLFIHVRYWLWSLRFVSLKFVRYVLILFELRFTLGHHFRALSKFLGDQRPADSKATFY